MVECNRYEYFMIIKMQRFLASQEPFEMITRFWFITFVFYINYYVEDEVYHKVYEKESAFIDPYLLSKEFTLLTKEI